MNRIAFSVVLVAAMVSVAGCKHKVVAKAPTAPPASPAPTAQLTASPAVVSAGDNVVLSWKTTDATSVSIEGIGTVSASGSKTITPDSSTSYHLVARGDGGSAEADARVTVNARPAVAAAPVNTMSEDDLFRANVHDIFFDYDKADLRTDSESIVARDAAFFKGHPTLKVVIGGYCDERGSDEYNLALGQSRAQSVEKALVAAGVPATNIRVISYGKEKPFCTDSGEKCWQQNRRAGFAMDRN